MKDNDVLPDGSKGIERVICYTYSKSNRIEDPVYILCSQCKYSFHMKWIKPKLTKKKMSKADFDFVWNSWKKSNKSKAGRKRLSKHQNDNKESFMDVDAEEEDYDWDEEVYVDQLSNYESNAKGDDQKDNIIEIKTDGLEVSLK